MFRLSYTTPFSEFPFEVTLKPKSQFETPTTLLFSNPNSIFEDWRPIRVSSNNAGELTSFLHFKPPKVKYLSFEVLPINFFGEVFSSSQLRWSGFKRELGTGPD